ncbi:bifunctional UDP-N-acetylmuramoyl-tripeptide:D-alanyl-D-alanine ligase/alanine racemase [Pararhodonellum marinum]|uniref:bifunctional UDP-N-acetylmuramoyl-tripeptide:D-alanyl-D-alanine ligase/alanine racemase n=1 Tax=Pararhodonellum marinum TaxID=2755358 RepID=UPI00188E9107|nr:bifunctional UDP-N-acetylmuramoyl-tripeptide:D-alanyl-D-alanine ligase/alanine racemase [Pararhodonellum marinum]
MVKGLSNDLILEICEGKWIQKGSDTQIDTISIDSRNIVKPESTLFLALKGLKSDGHDFVLRLFEKGLACALVEKKSWDPQCLSQYPRSSMILVENTGVALQLLAKYQRSCFHGTVVGITGSNGKTIVKEWAAQILSNHHALAKSPKSYNSQIGVPLSVFEIKQSDQIAILEAGISQSGEMQHLTELIQPTIGVFTNLGTAHEEGFKDRIEKLKEKTLLFDNCRYLIYNKDQTEVDQVLKERFPSEKLISWSSTVGSDYTLSVKKGLGFSKILMVKPAYGLFTFKVGFQDEASLENLRHVIVLCLTLGLSEIQIQNEIENLQAVDMRLTLKQGSQDCLIIDDTYNNDLAGFRLAIDFMQQQRPKKRRILIISDLLQVGDVEQVYREIGKLIVHFHFDVVLAVGQNIKALRKYFDGYLKFFDDTPALMDYLGQVSFENDLILVTGARVFEFERVVNKLQIQLHGTVLEINLNALSHNYHFFKSKLNPKTKVMVMVKAFAYGGGAIEIANHLQQLKADYLTVAYTDEGVALRKQGIQLPIMVLNPLEEAFHNLVNHDLDPVVYSLGFAKKLLRYCENHGLSMTVHLDLDTGMKRLGFEMDDLEELASLIKDKSRLKVGSIYTHLAGADEEIHEDFTRMQVKLFEEMYVYLTEKWDIRPLKHVLNSPGIIRYPEYQFDMVRLGIGLYGIEVNGWFDEKLQPISTLKTSVSQIKSLQKGESVGYGRKGIMDRDGKIATIAIGYADGYDRRFSNGKGKVLIRGLVAPVIGNVCMDMTMVDVTGIDVNEGDEVIVYGNQLSLKEMAGTIGTIPYELLTNVSSRVKRVYYLD